MRLELLSAQQRVQQVGAHEHRHDQPEEIRAAHVADERAERDASYPLDPVDQREQHREHQDPEDNRDYVHGPDRRTRAVKTA